MIESRKRGVEEEHLDGLTCGCEDLYGDLMNRYDEMLECDERNAE